MVVDLAGHVVRGTLQPSVDTETHLYVYAHRPDVLGICRLQRHHAESSAAVVNPSRPA